MNDNETPELAALYVSVAPDMPRYSDLCQELIEYQEEGHTDAILWTFATPDNPNICEALYLPATDRIGIVTGGNADWGDCHGEEDMSRAIVDYLTDADAWERRT